ncbi:hypothetical protein F1D61_27860 [Methylobacterium aquaticum]|nr:hypothetical protein F1D61_27860 [Methylobacterium aquaticum]
MSCRHHPDAGSVSSVLQAPSTCRRWRRWPSALPRPGNDNRHGAIAWLLWAAGGVGLCLALVLGVAAVAGS